MAASPGIRKMALFTSALAIGIALAGCAKEDGQRIIGTWRAERLDLMSLKLPLGPELEVRPDALTAGDAVRIPIAAITQDGDEVTLDTDSLIGMTFYFVEADRMYLELPVAGRIYYRRVAGPALAAVPVGAVTAPVVAVVAAPAPTVAAVAPPEAAGAALMPPPAPVYAHDYALALDLLRQGDRDSAVRALHSAFKQGFRDAALLERTPEFDLLKTDARYQALLARYGGQ